MAKKLPAFLLIIFLGLLFMACPADETTEYDTGTATATAAGAMGILTVTVTMDAGVIIDVVITGSDSTSYGEPVIATAKDRIIANQDFDHIDVVSGATLTRTAIKKAGDEAVAKIRRGEFDD
jgi:uncharacterized protein with FMN-binding domain